MHKNSRAIMGWFKSSYLDENKILKILDVGSLDINGNYNYKDIFDESNWSYTGLDVKEGNNVDLVVKDIYNWFEIEDNSYDVVISGQFLQNLEYYWLTMVQIERVLKPGGYVCIIAPSGGPNYNDDLLDCCRFTRDGIKAIGKYVGLNILRFGRDGRDLAKPWYDVYLFAQKSSNILNDENSLEVRVNNLEYKLDVLLNKVK